MQRYVNPLHLPLLITLFLSLPFPPHIQSVRQQSSSELDEMKGGVQELTQQISQADSTIQEIAVAVAELEKRKAKVCLRFHQ